MATCEPLGEMQVSSYILPARKPGEKGWRVEEKVKGRPKSPCSSVAFEDHSPAIAALPVAPTQIPRPRNIISFIAELEKRKGREGRQ